MGNKKQFLSGLALLIVIVVVHGVMNILVVPKIENVYLRYCIASLRRFGEGGLALLGAKKLLNCELGFRKENIAAGLTKYGWYFWVIPTLAFVMAAISPDENFGLTPANLLLLLIYCFSIGFFEESLFRVLGVRTFLLFFDNHRKGTLRALIVSAAIFGLCHLMNLIASPVLVKGTIAQILYSSMFGFALGVIYLRTRNIWPCIILHAITDVAGMFWSFPYLNEITENDTSFTNAILRVLVYVPFIIIGAIQFRKMFSDERMNV